MFESMRQFFSGKSADTGPCIATEAIREYLLGNLEQETAAEVETHLGGCRSCKRTSLQLGRVLKAVRKLGSAVETSIPEKSGEEG